jgi:hypothetical protein
MMVVINAVCFSLPNKVLVKGSAEQQQQQQRDTQPVQDKDVKPEAETVTPQVKITQV